jgi:hypothetical protein
MSPEGPEGSLTARVEMARVFPHFPEKVFPHMGENENPHASETGIPHLVEREFPHPAESVFPHLSITDPNVKTATQPFYH